MCVCVCVCVCVCPQALRQRRLHLQSLQTQLQHTLLTRRLRCILYAWLAWAVRQRELRLAAGALAPLGPVWRVCVYWERWREATERGMALRGAELRTGVVMRATLRCVHTHTHTETHSHIAQQTHTHTYTHALAIRDHRASKGISVHEGDCRTEELRKRLPLPRIHSPQLFFVCLCVCVCVCVLCDPTQDSGQLRATSAA